MPLTARDELDHIIGDMSRKEQELLLKLISEAQGIGCPPDEVTVPKLVKAVAALYKHYREVRCDICGRAIKSVEAAIKEGWIPSYWIGENEIDCFETGRPACPECQQKCVFDDPIAGIGEPCVLPAGQWLC